MVEVVTGVAWEECEGIVMVTIVLLCGTVPKHEENTVSDAVTGPTVRFWNQLRKHLSWWLMAQCWWQRSAPQWQQVSRG